MTGYGRSDLRPILRLEGLERGRKEIAIFHHDVAPLVLYEIANDGIHILPKGLGGSETGFFAQIFISARVCASSYSPRSVHFPVS
jgi:hypothetical protein